jgi:hypothetical protein
MGFKTYLDSKNESLGRLARHNEPQLSKVCRLAASPVLEVELDVVFFAPALQLDILRPSQRTQ